MLSRSSSALLSLSVLLAATQFAGCADYRASRALAPASTLVQGHFTRQETNPNLVLVCETRGISTRTCYRQSLRSINEALMERMVLSPYR